MSKLIVELPEDLHTELKRKAAIESNTLKEIVTSLLKEYINDDKTNNFNLKETGFCGVWDDKRSANEIIKDIKKERKWFKR